MAHFIKLAITEYDQDGAPAIGADDEWVNIEQITHMSEHLGNNLFRRHTLKNRIPPEHYPCLLITSSDGQERLVSLGVYPDAVSGAAAMDRFLPLIVGQVGLQTGDGELVLRRNN